LNLPGSICTSALASLDVFFELFKNCINTDIDFLGGLCNVLVSAESAKLSDGKDYNFTDNHAKAALTIIFTQ